MQRAGGGKSEMGVGNDEGDEQGEKRQERRTETEENCLTLLQHQ